MAPKSQPPGFEGSREIAPEDLESLPAITQDAVHTLESCIAEHHVADIDYKEPQESEETIRLRPAFIKTSTASVRISIRRAISTPPSPRLLCF